MRLLFYECLLDDLEADLVKVIEFAVSEFCLFEATGVPLLTSELVDCWLSLRGRIKPREYSIETQQQSITSRAYRPLKSIIMPLIICDKITLTSLGRQNW